MCHVPSSSDAESSEYVSSVPVGKRRKLRRSHLLIKARCPSILTVSIECECNFLLSL